MPPASNFEPRMLLVARHFPPDFAIGSLRPRRIAVHLRRFGWSIDVLTVRELYLDGIDETLCEGLEDAGIHRTHEINPRAWSHWLRPVRSTRGEAVSAPPREAGRRARAAAWARRLGSWLAARLEIPDRWCGWVPVAVVAGAMLPRPDVILATAPAFSNLIVGRLLAARFGAPLVLDYRDPWNPLERRNDLPRFRVRLEARLEQWCLAGATEIVATTPGIAGEIAAIAGHPVKVVTNACEPERFQCVERRRFDRPTIVYAGGLYGDRKLDPILNAMARLRDAGRLAPEDIRLLYMGRTPEEATEATASRGLQDFVEIHGVQPAREALAATAGATCNLSLVGAAHTRQIPAKIFEHIAAGRPMLAVAPPDSDTRTLLRDIPWARCIAPGDLEGLEQALLGIARGETEPRSTAIPAHLTAEATMRELDDVLRTASRAGAGPERDLASS